MRTVPAAVSFRASFADWRIPVLLMLLAMGALGGGIATLLRQQRSGIHEELATFAAVLLLLTACVQAKLAWRQSRLVGRRSIIVRQPNAVRQSNNPTAVRSDSRKALAMRLASRLLTGAVVCYLLALAIGTRSTAPCVFAAGSMIWLTGLLLPFAAPPEAIDHWRRVVQGRGPRLVTRLAQVTLLLGVVAELSLRAAGWLNGSQLLKIPDLATREFATATLAATESADSSKILPPSKHDARSSAGWSGFRIAVVGDEIALGAAGPNGAFPILESALPVIKIFNFSAPKAGPPDYACQGVRNACRWQADVILTFVSVADDIVNEPQRESLFDWRSLCVPQMVLRYAGQGAGDANASPPSAPASALATSRPKVRDSADDWDAYVAACGPQLTVCRTPISATVQSRWKTTLRHLDDLMNNCRRTNTPFALVIVPSPLQTNRPLLDAVCRREGCGPAEVDVELPQRRLAAYAADRNIPLFDLLPALKLSPEQPYVHQGWHWTAAGNAAAAQALTGWLQSTFGPTLAKRRPELGPLSATDNASWLVARRQ